MEITSLSPTVGPLSGGNTVTITGTKFTGATSVTFGGVSVPSFTINSATQITVSVPAGLSPGQVDVTVTTPSGTVTVVNAYSYLQSDFASGDGTVGNPYVIANAEQLDNVRDHLDAHFVLSGDIDLDVAPYNTGGGWTPIGTISAPFTGTFDGDGNEIDGLFINGGNEVGLFGVISGSADIRDLQLTNVDVTGGGSVGALVGFMQGGSIETASVQGRVENTGGFSSYTGGLVGRTSPGTEVLFASADMTISGSGNVGGLVGANEGDIEQSFAKGEIGQVNFRGIGGLVGVNYGSINQSYSLTDITNGGTAEVGGLVGENRGVITVSYAAGNVNTSATTKGGLVGLNSGSVSRSYYDSVTSGQSDIYKGIALTTAQMKQQASFSGWNFISVWENQGDSTYPTLRWE